MTGEVLFINGCPRKDGVLLRSSRIFLEMLAERGWRVEEVDLYDTRLAPCRGCLRCRENGMCILDDDASGIAKKLHKADLVVMAAPTFFANVPGPAKNFMDRMSGAAFDTKLRPRFSSDTGYLLLTSCGVSGLVDRISGQSAGAIRAMRMFFGMSGMRFRGSLVVTGAYQAVQPSESLRRKMMRLARGECKSGWILHLG